MEKRRYLLVDAAVLPEVFERVLYAKELIASGEAKNVSKATTMADVSRSAFYKYRDSVFRADNDKQTAIISATLLDKTGALQELLAAISSAGAGVVTINQGQPENGIAVVSVSVRTEGMQIGVDELCLRLKQQKLIVSAHWRK